MKKVFINVMLILIGFVIYFLQSNFFSWFTIAGIKPNFFVVYILFIGLFATKNMTIIYATILGIILDLLFKQRVGENLISLLVVGIIAILFNKNFSKDSRITIMVMVLVSTVVFEGLSYFISYILYSMNMEILEFIKILLIEVVFNILVTIIIYPLIQKFGYYIENEYKVNKILTRYF